MTIYEAFIDELNKLAAGMMKVPGGPTLPGLYHMQKSPAKSQPLRPGPKSQGRMQAMMKKPKPKVPGLAGAFA